MCGIFGIFNESTLDQTKFLKSTKCFFELSKTRGQDSSGLACLDKNDNVIVHRRSMPPEKFISSSRVKNILGTSNQNRLFIGHSRLATNGPLYKLSNNQPQYTDQSFCIHNGIITNIEDLWQKYPNLIRENDVDTEFIPKFFDDQLSSNKNVHEVIAKLFSEVEGTVSLALFSKISNSLVLSTNNGSLYYFKKGEAIYFASERLILQKFLKRMQFPEYQIVHAANHQVIEVENVHARVRTIIDTEHLRFKKINDLKRCTKCVLPETFPGIYFDDQGICNICHTYIPYTLRDKSTLKFKLLMTFKRFNMENVSPC